MTASDPHSIVDGLYEAAALPERLPAALGMLATAARASGAILIGRTRNGLHAVASSPAFQAHADAYFAQFGPHNDRLLRLLAYDHAGFVADTDVFTPDEIARSDMFQDFLIPRGYGAGIATVLSLGTGEDVIVHMEGPAAAGGLDGATRSTLDGIRPHLARSVLLASRLADKAARSAVSVLQQMGQSGALVGLDGTLREANPAFQGDDDLWTTGAGGRFVLRHAATDAAFHLALRAVQGQPSVRSIPVLGARGAAVLHLVPLRGLAQDLLTGGGAIVVVTRVRRRHDAGGTLLRALFDLTPAEARIARAIGAGDGADLIAVRTGRAIETVRNQIKRVMAKCGCTRQAELAVLVANLLPPGEQSDIA